MAKKFQIVRQSRNLMLGPVRLVYAHILEPWVREGEDPAKAKYQTGILIPDSNTEAIEAINAAIDAAIAHGTLKTWGGSTPKKLDRPLRSEEDKENPGPEYKGMLWMNAKSRRKPSVVNRKLVPITDPDEVYSGCWAMVNIEMFPYDQSGKKGISCSLNSVMKVRDDERLGGGTMDAATAFKGVDSSMFDDDDTSDDDF